MFFCLLTSAIGWLVIIVSVASSLITGQTLDTDIGGYLFVGSLGTGAFGFGMVMAGQMAKAMLDNTNANLEILHVLRKLAGNELHRKEPTL